MGSKLPENTLHLFSRCKHACNVWQYYKPIYSKLLPNIPFIYEQAALTINLRKTVNSKTRKLTLTLTELIVKELWTTRNNWLHNDIEPSKIRSKNRINKNI